MPQKQHARQLGADRAGLDDCVTAESRPSLSQNGAARQAAERRLRRQRLVEPVNRLGPRVLFELLDELVRVYPEIGADIDRRLGRFAALDPEVLRAVDGGTFPPLPIRLAAGAI
jgi:hypothetical protein